MQKALAAVLSATPTDAELACAMSNLRDRAVQRPRSSESSGRPMLLSFAASVAFLVMCFVASTDAWADVTRDFQSPSNEPKTISTLNSPSVADTGNRDSTDTSAPGSAARLVLLVHVASLVIGLLGMLASWLIILLHWWRTHLTRRHTVPRVDRIGHRVLIGALAFYAVGILFGCLWSQVTWGRPWSWDPRESFALISFGLGIVWLSSPKLASSDCELNLKSSTNAATVASIAFGMISLMLSLGGIYASNSRTYGFPSNVPTMITGIVSVTVLVLWTVHFSSVARRRGERSSQVG
ncbi:MAG: cytochrome c biogenesis protein CcsA [Planctomycetota bacterium]